MTGPRSTLPVTGTETTPSAPVIETTTEKGPSGAVARSRVTATSTSLPPTIPPDRGATLSHSTVVAAPQITGWPPVFLRRSWRNTPVVSKSSGDVATNNRPGATVGTVVEVVLWS